MWAKIECEARVCIIVSLIVMLPISATIPIRRSLGQIKQMMLLQDWSAAAVSILCNDPSLAFSSGGHLLSKPFLLHLHVKDCFIRLGRSTSASSLRSFARPVIRRRTINSSRSRQTWWWLLLWPTGPRSPSVRSITMRTPGASTSNIRMWFYRWLFLSAD